MTLNNDKLKAIRQDANNAFWEAVADALPEVKTGDFPPSDYFKLAAAMEEAIQSWYGYNAEQTTTILTWRQLKISGKNFDASALPEEIGVCSKWLWDELPNLPNVWQPVIDLSTSTKKFMIADLTGRGFVNNNAGLDGILELDEEGGDTDLKQWAIDAETGEEWANAALRIECINE